MTRKVTCKPHPMSGLETGPTLYGPDDAQIDLLGGGAKAMQDVLPGDYVVTYRNGSAFEVLTNEVV